MSNEDLNNNEENTSEENVGRVISLGINETIGTSDKEPSDFEITDKSLNIYGRSTVTGNVNRDISFSVTVSVKKGQPAVYWTNDKQWQNDYNWVKALDNVDKNELVNEENLHFRERASKSFVSQRTDGFDIADDKTFNVTSNNLVGLRVVDTPRTAHTMQRWKNDGFSINDSVAKTITIRKTESLRILDGMLRAAQGIVSDVIFESGTWDAESIRDAARNGRHAGYGKQEPFIVGNHTYSSALFRTAIDANSLELGLLTDFQVLVDVQDVNDRGSASITNVIEETFIRYNKTFLIEPDVVVSMRTGTSSSSLVPVLGEVTLEGFFVKVVDLKTDAQTTGAISWIATGY